METLFLLGRIPMMKRKNIAYESLSIAEQAIDLLGDSKLYPSTKQQLIWLLEAAKVCVYVLKKYSYKPTELLDDTVESSEKITRKLMRKLRPLFYLLAMIVWGRNSWRALLISLLFELFSDKKTWGLYLLRFPLDEKFTGRLLPKIFRHWLVSYTKYISYII